MGQRICRIAVYGFAALYLLALALFVIGTFGLFGQEADPLSAVFLIPIGLPWNQFLDGFGDGLRPWLAALAPLLNLFFLGAICRFLRTARRKRD